MMSFEKEIRASLGVRAADPLSSITIRPSQIEALKNVVFDYWDRHTQSILEQIKSESPRDPPRLAATLILAGYEKVIFVRRKVGNQTTDIW